MKLPAQRLHALVLLTWLGLVQPKQEAHHRVRHAADHVSNQPSSGTAGSDPQRWQFDFQPLDTSKENQLQNLIRIQDHSKSEEKEKISLEFDQEGTYVFDITQENPSPAQMGGINIIQEAQKLAAKLRMLSSEECGLTTIQAIYDSLPFIEAQPSLDQQLDKLTTQLSSKLYNYLQALKNSKQNIESLYSQHLRQPIQSHYNCCSVPSSSLRWSEQHKLSISKDTSCDLIPGKIAANISFNPSQNLTEVFQHCNQNVPSIRWQYFISTQGLYNLFPAYNFYHPQHSECPVFQDDSHREAYISSILPQRKSVVIVVDHGNSLSPRQMHLAKTTAKYILNSLSVQDRVAVFGLTSDIQYPKEDGCDSYILAPLSYEAKLYYGTFVDSLEKAPVSTNHSLGFEEAFTIIQNTMTAENEIIGEQVLIAYISRGLLTSLKHAKEIMQMIATRNGQLDNRVVINTYVVIDADKPIMYETTFLRDVAEQNFNKFHVQAHSTRPIPVSKMVAVTSEADLVDVGHFYETLNLTYSNKPKISPPIKDEIGEGIVLPITWPCFYDDVLLGVAGLDIDLADVVESITYFTREKNAYAFLIDTKGSTIMHPALRRPILANVQPMHTDVSHFEQHPGFDQVLSQMLQQPDGHVTLELPNTKDNLTYPHILFTPPINVKVTYMWRHVLLNTLDEAPFIVVIKKSDNGFKLKALDSRLRAPEGEELIYHRLDLLPTDNTCMHLKHLATLDSSSLFLSASAFKKPYEHLTQPETKRMVQGYLVYLNDNTALISNPGLKENVRKDVAAISQVNAVWQNKVRHGSLDKYIVRRFVTTPSGATGVYPGTFLNTLFDPTKREWYKRAMMYPGRVTLTAPYLDPGGAGYTVTISHTLYEGKHAALHGPFDQIVAVLGMDVTLKYLYKVLMEQLPVCEQETVRCFIMDDRGYLIAHKSLVDPSSMMGNKKPGDPTSREPLEQRHISNQEPLVANDILNHQGFVRKKLCNSFIDRTMQRFYQFNTSLTGVVTNLVHGEHCAKYQLTPVPGTNTFLGIVNQTCDMATAFCPCSVVDRLCLNCHRMEQTECECPCECPLDIDYCTGELLTPEDKFVSCPQYPEMVDRAMVSEEVASKLPQCFPVNCGSFTTKKACLGVVDCEWCELDVDRKTKLSQPFCSTQRVCFSGVLGAQTPYSDHVTYKAPLQDSISIKSAPVGPVAGGIMGCFLLLALGVYCYRHHIHRHSDQYITALPEGQRNYPLDTELEEELPDDNAGTGHTNFILAPYDAASMSPYRANASYRRQTNAESGYSTMTPQDDSEQASTYIEPLLTSRDRYRPHPTTAFKMNPILPPPPSSGRRSCSPTPPQTTQRLMGPLIPYSGPIQTIIPNTAPETTVLPDAELRPHQVIANVQVHMVDTH